MRRRTCGGCSVFGSESIVPAVTEALSIDSPVNGELTQNSLHHRAAHIAGKHVVKALKLDVNGAANVDIFTVTGVVRVLSIEAYATTVTDSTTLSGFKFELWDGTSALDITGAVNASGIVIGGFIFKEGLAAAPAELINPTVGIVQDAASDKKSYQPFWLAAKAGAGTTIRVAYTGDATTDVDMEFEVHYVPVADDTTAAIVPA